MISLQNNKGMWQPVKFSAKEFRDVVINIFPEIEKNIDEGSGVHVIYGVLTERCQTAIKNGEFGKLKNLFEILDNVITLKDTDSEIENGIQISFLQLTDFADPKNGKSAFELLPQSLKQIISAA